MDAVAYLVKLPRPVADALDRGATVLTGNQRAARTLRVAFDRRNRIAGLGSWQPAAALAWDAWTAELWRGLLLEGNAVELLLSRTQEHVVWRSIIAADPEMRNTLRSADSLAELAADAWRLLGQYNGMERFERAPGNFETRTFQRWAAEFERRCRSERWLSPALLDGVLARAVTAGHLRLPSEIALVGFDEILPARRGLIDSLRASGVQVDEIESALPIDERVMVRAGDEQGELSAAARWARGRLQQSPDARIAVIVPGLESRRAVIDRMFREVLAPELEDIAAANDDGPYEFSVGVKLAETPPVRVAVDLLRWMNGPLPLERASSLLVSPLFAANEAESGARASFDAFELRRTKLLRPEVTLAWMAGAVSRSRRRPQLASTLKTLLAMEHAAARQAVATAIRAYTEWTDSIRELLEVALWGRGKAEDSVEFQTRKRWEATLDELATLDFDGSRVSFDEALRELVRLVRQTTFAPESREAPVQVMGPLEAAGSSFDAVWFLGAGDLTWPSRAATNPLLPWPLQVELGLPGTDANTDDARARRIGERIAQSAATVVFSYAAESDAGRQRPTPPLEALQLHAMEAAEIAPEEETAAAIALDEFADLAPLPLVNRVQGGVDILSLQAACGFRAFAERRLWSRELKSVELGMDAGERGDVVHKALEHLWKEIQTQAELKAMGAAQRSAALDRAIEAGLRRGGSPSVAWDRAYMDVQRLRLRALLLPWLEIELKREKFAVKLSEEGFVDVPIGPLQLSVRVDRVDTSEAGEIIIDYKTGGVRPADWLGNRPDAPQLPLYAVLASAANPETPLAEIAFGRIRAGREMALDGFQEKVTADARKTNTNRLPLDEQLEVWRRVLTDLAESFHHGDVRVDPKNYPLTCSHCAQRTLCRLDPATFDEDLDDEAGMGAGNG